MAKHYTFLLFSIFALADASSVQPRDLLDEAEKQLQELETIVRVEIVIAQDTIDDLSATFVTDSLSVMDAAVVSLEQEEATINQQLGSIEDLAHAAGKDITSCTAIPKELLGRLPNEYFNSLDFCIAKVNYILRILITDAKYVVDVVINPVHALASQVRACRGEILCISPLLTEIQLNKIRLPQNIQTEVQAIESAASTSWVSVRQCSDTNISGYAADAGNLLSDITDCVNRILG